MLVREGVSPPVRQGFAVDGQEASPWWSLRCPAHCCPLSGGVKEIGGVS